MPSDSCVYRPRNPKISPYYQGVEDRFETFDQMYEDCFERKYGFFRPYVGLSLNPKHNSHFCMIRSQKSEFLSISIKAGILAGGVQRHDFRQGFDELLAQAVGVSPLIGDQQQITGLDALAEIAVSPNVVRGAKRAEDKALVLRF